MGIKLMRKSFNWNNFEDELGRQVLGREHPIDRHTLNSIGQSEKTLNKQNKICRN